MVRLGYIHEDLHLDNIMLKLKEDDSIEDLYLIDWGKVMPYSKTRIRVKLFTDDIFNAVWKEIEILLRSMSEEVK